MKQLFALLLILFLAGCNSPAQTDSKKDNARPENNKLNESMQEFKLENYKITKGHLGNIKIGMTVAQAETHFRGLRKEVDEATNFGFGGGSPAFLYYFGDELIFGLIPELDNDSLLFIIAASKKLQTSNGLNPKSTVKELVQKYPNMRVSQNLMNGWEYFQPKEYSPEMNCRLKPRPHKFFKNY